MEIIDYLLNDWFWDS